MLRPVARRPDSLIIQQLGTQLPGHRHHNGAHGGIIPPACNPKVLELQLRDHVLAIAESIHAGGWDRARHLLELLSRRVSTTGDVTERVAAYFFEALVARYSRLSSGTGAIEYAPTLSQEPTSEERFSAYVALNTVTPCLQFAHITATQALLEALTADGEEFIHIVDVDIAGYGTQWPCFLQALVEQEYSIKRVRITGIGNSLSTLQRIGTKLADLAYELRLPFEFIPLVHHLETLTPDMLDIEESEAVGVNCIMQLHTLLTRGPEMLTNFLAMLESLEPKVVTLAEAEASLNSPYFLDRFQHAWHRYSLLFETLDATLPASSAQRARIEEVCYRGEILNVVAFEGSERFVRHQSFSLWQRFFDGNGFENLAPSWRTLSYAQSLLKTYHPEDGYRIVEHEGSVRLGWHDQPLFTFSTWKLAEMEE